MKMVEMDKRELAERLILSVINNEDGKERLFNFPSVERGPFSLVAQVCLGEKNLEGKYTSCVTVTNDIMNGWGISKSEMFDMAVANSKKLFPILIEPLNELARRLDENGQQYFLTDGVNLPTCLVLSNEYFFNGAAAMFYEPEALDKIAAKFKVSSLYILPSSTNHIFCVPKSSLMEAQEYTDVFTAFISAKPDGEKPLADKVMHYDVATKQVTYDGVNFSPAITDHSNTAVEAANKTTHR